MDLSSLIPHPTTPLGSSILQALMGKHGITMPTSSPHAGADAGAPGPSTAPKVGVDLSNPGANAGAIVGDMPVDIPGGDTPLANPGANDIGGLQKFTDSASIKPAGFLDRIGDFLHSDDGRATMMRFAAGAFNGGLGGGLGAATSFADQRRKERAAAADEATQDAFKTQELGDNRQWRMGQLDNEAQQNANTAAYQRGQLAQDDYRTTSENWRSGLHERGETGRVGMQQQGENYRTGMTVGEQRYAHDNPSGDTTATQAGETFRQQNPVATPARPVVPTLQTHVHYTTTPEDYAKNGPRLRPSQVHPNAPATQINSDAEYAALPSGTRFVGPDGQVRVKP